MRSRIVSHSLAAVVVVVVLLLIGWTGTTLADYTIGDISCSVGVSVSGSTASLSGMVTGPKIDAGGVGYTGTLVIDYSYVTSGSGDAGVVLGGSRTGMSAGTYTAYTRGSSVNGAECEASQSFTIQ